MQKGEAVSTGTQQQLTPQPAKPPAAPQKTVEQWLRDPGMVAELGKTLPAHITPDRFARVALTAMQRVPKLRECTQASVMRCLMDCSSLGIEPDGRRAHLIPYGNECKLIIDYKGMVELVRRSGDVAKIHADIVCDNDQFEVDLGTVTRHVISYREPRGNIYAVYAMATLRDGSVQCAVMTKDEVEAIRKTSKSGTSGPWVSHWAEMAKKTAFRRLCKWLTLSPEIRTAIEIDDRHTGIVETSARTVEALPVGGNDRLAALLEETREPGEEG